MVEYKGGRERRRIRSKTERERVGSQSLLFLRFGVVVLLLCSER